jgi:hypothetical protein
MRSYDTSGFQPLSHGVLQRKCSCGGSGAGVDNQCEDCRSHALQRKAVGSAPLAVPSSVHETISSPGRPLDADTRGSLEPRFHHDFSRVRVHTDVSAGESAQEVGAAAYTVGHNVVFAPGNFAPTSEEGRTLLAHELAHVVQQESGDPGRLVSAPEWAEREADSAAAQVQSGAAHTLSLGRTGLNLSLQPTGGGTQPKVDPVIEAARSAAFVRVLMARDRVGGLGPGAPNDPQTGTPMPDINAYENQQKARRYASLFFEWPNPNMDQVHDILGSMMTALSPGMPVTRAAATDPNCGTRAGYVTDHKPPIVLCPAFFTSTPEEQIRTMVHESAHRAGIGQPNGEGYCAVFDYSGPCPGGFDSADSWAQFVNAVTDRPPDKPQVITAPKGGSTKGGTGGGGAKP